MQLYNITGLPYFPDTKVVPSVAAFEHLQKLRIDLETAPFDWDLLDERVVRAIPHLHLTFGGDAFGEQLYAERAEIPVEASDFMFDFTQLKDGEGRCFSYTDGVTDMPIMTRVLQVI